MALSFNSTSISTYSIQEAALDKAKQEPLQINLNLLCDHSTNDVQFPKPMKNPTLMRQLYRLP